MLALGRGMSLPRLLGRARRSRLVHFAAIGGALYALALRGEDRRVVEIDGAVLGELRDSQAKKLGVAALPEAGRREVDGRAIEDEILYREALRLRLDRDDPIVRQRLVQKLLLLVEDLGGASRDPSPAELRAYFEATRERWRRPARYHFVHVFAAQLEALPSAASIEGAVAAPSSGEAFPYPRDVRSSREEVARVFGAAFADGVVALAEGEVSAALRSPFGWHRVRLVERVAGAPAAFEEVAKDVHLDYLLARREQVVGAYLTETAATYDVRVSGVPLQGFVPTRRVAARAEGSAED